MIETKRKEHGFIEGSVILLVATALVKVLGAIFKIPLNNILGELGAGYYTTAYDLYLPLYSLATAGIPIAISRTVAAFVAQKRYKDVAITLKVALKSFSVLGFLGFAVLIGLAYPFVYLTGNGDMYALLPVVFVAPCILFCCIAAVYRGYYEGLKNMTLPAISNVIEAGLKLVFGLSLSYLVIVIRGDKTMKTLSVAAAAAMLGIVLSSAVSCIYLAVKYKKSSSVFSENELKLSKTPFSQKEIFKILYSIAVPVIICSLLTNITSLIDVIMVKNRLTSALRTDKEYLSNVYAFVINKNMEADKNFTIWNLPTALYGCHRSYAYSIYNLVPVITGALGVSLVPVLSDAWVQGNRPNIKENIENMLKTTALIAMPAGLGILALSKPILNLLYSSNPAAVEVASKNLAILGICAVFSGLCIPILNMLQAIGKPKIPLYNMLIGAVIKIVLNYVLVSNPKINIIGVPIATTACFAYIAVANFMCLLKCSKVRINMLNVLIKPLIASALCAVSANITYDFGIKIINSGKIVTVISILIAVNIYALAVILLKIVQKNDILSIIIVKKLVKTLEKFRIFNYNK